QLRTARNNIHHPYPPECCSLSDRSTPHPRHVHSIPTRRSSDLNRGTAKQPTKHSAPIQRGAHCVTSFFANLLEAGGTDAPDETRSEEHTSELQSRSDLVCRLLLEKKKSNCMKSSIVMLQQDLVP